MKIVRWILVPECAAAGFCAAVVVSFAATGPIERWCPGGEVVSGVCSVSWVNQLPMTVGAVLLPILIGIPTVLMAPSHRVNVTWVTYFLGCAAVINLFLRPFPAASVLAMVAGLIVGGALHWRFKA